MHRFRAVRRCGARFSSTAVEDVKPLNRGLYKRPLRTPQYGSDILHDSLWNKGTGFTEYERSHLGLRGLLPPAHRDLEQQKKRVMRHLDTETSNEKKNLYLQDLQARNETLYFRVLVDHIEKMAPLVYTPTVGYVCQQFGNQFRRPRGMYFSKYDVGHMSSIVKNWPHNDVHVIVVTDGSRILGLGDLGINGMGIPIGKLALYCAAGGIAPHRVLPIMLDVGTNTESLLQDEDYLGIKEKRLTGQAYYDFVDEFMAAVFSRWPNVIVQFEDFESTKAVGTLERYRNSYRMFNDDIQGTGSVTLSGVMSAVKITKQNLKDIKVVCAGAGSAGLGVCDQIVEGMMEAGLTQEEAMSRFVICDSKGAIGNFDGKNGNPHQTRKLKDYQEPWINKNVSDGTSLANTILDFKPNLLLGLSTIYNLFDETVLRNMGKVNERPIIMPMSNPTSKCECTPEEAYRYTDGRAVVATGSPFDPVKMPDGRVFIPSQCNNMYIFPGIGLAASVSGVSRITNKMLYKAAEACNDTMTQAEKDEGRTFPNIKRIREVAKNVAIAVIEQAFQEDLVTKISQIERKEGLEKLVQRKMYFPEYYPLVSARNEHH